MKRLAVAVGIVAVAISGAVFAAAGAAQSPAQTSLHLVSTSQPSVGFPPEHEKPHPGDRFGIGDKITGDDTGVDRVACTVMSKHDALCTAVVSLSKGTLTAESLVRFKPGPTHYAVTGGTGAYAGANGSAVVTDIPGTDKADIQITLLP